MWEWGGGIFSDKTTIATPTPRTSTSFSFCQRQQQQQQHDEPHANESELERQRHRHRQFPYTSPFLAPRCPRPCAHVLEARASFKIYATGFWPICKLCAVIKQRSATRASAGQPPCHAPLSLPSPTPLLCHWAGDNVQPVR